MWEFVHKVSNCLKTGFNPSTYTFAGNAKPFSSAKKRLNYLLERYNKLQQIVALLINYRAVYKDRTLGQLLNQNLRINDIGYRSEIEENELDAISYMIRILSIEDFHTRSEDTKKAISTFSEGIYRNTCRDLLNWKWVSLDTSTKFCGEKWIPLRLSNTFKSSLKGAFTKPIQDMYTSSISSDQKEKYVAGENNDDECKPFDSFEIAHALAAVELDVDLKVLNSSDVSEKYTTLSHARVISQDMKKFNISQCHTQLFKDTLNRIHVANSYKSIAEFDLLELEISEEDVSRRITRGDKFNRELSHAFLSKVHSLLMESPGCTLKELHSVTPTISERHTTFLIDQLISQNLAYSREIANVVKINDLFAPDACITTDATTHYFARSLE